ncbi:prolyl oligopeptidase family serine peptidase [Simiduia curdlanivorans]|uniref:Prolyl oligopeptidase family protein n=1 Tax=Simiduia curdlanivorans TaxID=1492769 RepID=A0ABV8V6I0_9GAMM|nr:prolyl oligopeptidase family serine peptidase [Simiduia curdlanivorans]MDN3639291.1 prolyl oligopeptidase family serine peptidase [Simiduia curdlanivorans]
MFRYLACFSLLLNLLACSTEQDSAEDYQWLEQVEGKAAIAWVDANNSETAARLGKSALYQPLYDQALAILSSPERLPKIDQKGDYVYNLWQDTEHPRGVYRRSLVSDFIANAPVWQTVVDLDALSAEENKKWVFKGLNCLAPEYRLCLLSLSEGGGDTIEVREFNTETLSFVAQGFNLAAAKTNIDWIDENQVYLGTDFGADSQTDSGYPRQVRIWSRGTAFTDAKLLYSADKSSVSASGHRYKDGQFSVDIITDATTFWESRYQLLANGKLSDIALPSTATINDFIKGQLLVSLKQEWQFNGRLFPEGAVLLIRPQALVTPEKAAAHDIALLIEPSPEFIVEELHASPRGILAIGLVDVKAQARLYTSVNGNWRSQALDLPSVGSLSIETIDQKSGAFFARFEDFLTPPSLYYLDTNLKSQVVAAQAASFDASELKVEQYFAQSADGTQVPYFAVMKKDTQFDGKNPTHIFSYGGFRVSLKPSYSGSYEDLNGVYGKLWLERGGVFVLANIRGGGEYGPAWHSSVLLENRHKAYEDFEAVAQDLVNKKITSAKHLGIEGRSNGGLLVAATMVRHPELYGAVISGVPLLDMQRYHRLLAGASWMAEYGNPDIESNWQWLKTYSPFQKVSAEQQYPPILFYTSTKDDRVHPGHARKMAAKMKAQGHRVEYYENREGGHGGSSTKEQLAKRVALGYTLLWETLR